ncbi:MAG: hypothetical protein NC416_10580 [Eubacterium sp.]|nr:hypothetical protein [Eubacterium sp.]
MAKKFGKILMVTAALGAVAAGAYYCLRNKDNSVDDNFDDDDDFDNFDDDLDEEEKAQEADRNYVDLDLEKADEFKEGLDAAKAEATDKVVGAAKEAAEAVKETADKAEVKVEEFFDDEDADDSSTDAME